MKMIIGGSVVVAGVVLATAFGGPVLAAASPSSSVTVQDSGKNGAGVDSDGDQDAYLDTDGTQGDFTGAVDGTSTPPLMDAVPQTHAQDHLKK